MREIEVKYRVTDVAALLAALRERGVAFSRPVRQDDQAYAPAGWSYGMSKLGVPFARLRTQEERHLFTVKKPVDNELVCVEHETEVTDRDRMHAAVVAMGFVPTVRVVKSRRTATLGTVSLTVDHVEHIGTFLEAETIVAGDHGGPRTQAELGAFVRGLGVTGQPVAETYDSLVRAAVARRPENGAGLS